MYLLSWSCWGSSTCVWADSAQPMLSWSQGTPMSAERAMRESLWVMGPEAGVPGGPARACLAVFSGLIWLCFAHLRPSPDSCAPSAQCWQPDELERRRPALSNYCGNRCACGQLPRLLSHLRRLSGGHMSWQPAYFFPWKAGVGQGNCWPRLFPGQTRP